MYQNGDIEIWFKTDRRTRNRIKEKIFFKRWFCFNKKYHENIYHALIHTEPGRTLLTLHYENRDARFSLDKERWINYSEEKELLDDAMKILTELAGSGVINIISMTTTEEIPVINR